jgi:hypothetical protein
MRMIALSALFALGVGLAGTTGASAAPVAGLGLLNAPTASESLVEQAQYYRGRGHCRTVRVCSRGSYGRRHCRMRTVCGRR